MRLQDYDITTTFQASVVRTERITPSNSAEEVRDITLDIAAASFDAQAGQCVGVLAPGRSEFGQDHHFRLYSLADLPEPVSAGVTRVRICVRRCNYIDEYSGEEYHGVASHYLCDLTAGATVTVTGPYEIPFEVPDEPDATMILIGAGTGIAPFRAFLKQVYRESPEYHGRIWLFHGGSTGLDLLYHNDERNDFAQYYDRETFEAITALSQRSHWSDTIDWTGALSSRGAELWRLLSDSRTHVYVAGLEPIRDELDTAIASVAGSQDQWQRRKAELIAGGRWTELVY